MSPPTGDVTVAAWIGRPRITGTAEIDVDPMSTTSAVAWCRMPAEQRARTASGTRASCGICVREEMKRVSWCDASVRGDGGDTGVVGEGQR